LLARASVVMLLRVSPRHRSSSTEALSRREALGLFGAAGAVLVLGCRSGSGPTDGYSLSCVLDPTLTQGPYWIDERLHRSDIRSDSHGLADPNPRPGLPLTLRFTVLAYAGGNCAPLTNAQVDVWHCDGIGLYSDVNGAGGSNTTGQDFLRGYQLTDSNGLATFTTIYPGWYSGRAVHIHVKVRTFDAANNTITEATTQVFFDDALTDAVYAANAPYNTRGPRDTRNMADAIYGRQTELLLSLSGSPSSGYTGSINLGVQVGMIHAG
jgi:protocatechuate 3,4-dioxygenase beta subunit